MKIILSLNNENLIYDYKSMGIDTFVLGCTHSFYTPKLFSIDEINTIVENNEDCHFYVSMNHLYDQTQIKEIETFIKSLSTKVTGILFHDLGVLQIVKENHLNFKMIYNPETLNTNVETINTLSKYGIDGAMVSRVIPLEEALEIQKSSKVPTILFGHGVEYVAATKRELISNYNDVSHLSLEKNHTYRINNKDSDLYFLMYEDHHGTHFFTETRLYTLDLFNIIKDFDYLYIETLFMDEQESIETASIYSDCLNALNNHSYDKEVKEYLPLLRKLGYPMSQGFLFDNTVYKLDEIRKLDDERNK